MDATRIKTLLPQFVMRPFDSELLKNMLQPGRVYWSRILRQLDKNQYLIHLKGHNFVASSDTEHEIGTRLMVELMQVEPKIELRVLSERERERRMAAAGGRVIKQFDETVVLEMRISTSGHFALQALYIPPQPDLVCRAVVLFVAWENSTRRATVFVDPAASPARIRIKAAPAAWVPAVKRAAEAAAGSLAGWGRPTVERLL